MTPDNDHGSVPLRDMPVPAGSLHNTSTPGICVGCRQPLTKRGADGECLRCLVGFALTPAGDTDADDSLESSDCNVPKRRYGHFEIDTAADGLPLELGAGAMAVTYRAQDTVLRSAVALKVIHKNVAAHPLARDRFLREARAAARLHHPNVAAVSHYGEQDGECYYVMELVEGETLESRLRRDGPLPVELTLEIGIQVTRALAAAEACGVMHRDLKPSNIMLTERQGESGGSDALTVKVIDWGLAKAVGAAANEADHTRHGFVGTPAFASPEQFVRVENTRVDTRTDIYSLGVTLWYLLCGRTPFTGSTLQEIHGRQVREPLPLAQLTQARVPAGIVALFKSMLAVDPTERPQSARELLDTMRRLQQPFVRRALARKHRRQRLWFAVILGLLILIVGAGAWWLRTRPLASLPDRSIAVLPFENLSPDDENAFFTTGVQDEITTDLARIASLKVIGPDSTRSYSPNDHDYARIGRELGVRYLLEGNVARARTEVCVEVSLIDIQHPSQPWGTRLDRRLSDVFAVQGEITRAVAARLDAALTPREKADINDPPTSDLAAYDLYLRAREGPKIFNSPLDARARHASKVPLLEAAVARDPNFVLAYCDLANAHDALNRYRLIATPEERTVDHRALAEVALAQAQRLRPDAGEVHLAAASHFYQSYLNLEQARIEVDLARKKLPNSAEVEGTDGMIARSQNRWNDAVRCLQKAVALEPNDTSYRFTLANTYRFLRRYEECDRLMAQIIATMTPHDSVGYRLGRGLIRVEQSADLSPLRAALAGVTATDEPDGELRDEYGLILALDAHDADAVLRILAATAQPRFVFHGVAYPKAWYEALAARLRHDGDGARAAFAKARVEVDRAVQASAANDRLLSVLAIIDAGLGNKDDAVREALRARALVSVDKAADAPVVAANLAVVYAWTDQPDLACATLEEWIDRPAGGNLPSQLTYGDLKLSPFWDPLQGNARFIALTARLAPANAR